MVSVNGENGTGHALDSNIIAFERIRPAALMFAAVNIVDAYWAALAAEARAAAGDGQAQPGTSRR